MSENTAIATDTDTSPAPPSPPDDSGHSDGAKGAAPKPDQPAQESAGVVAKADAPANKKAPAPKKKAVAPKKKAVAPKKKAVAPKKKAVAPKKKAVAPKKRVPPKRTPPKRKRVRRRSAKSRSRKPTGKKTSFKVDDKVVHPHHGAAVITKQLEVEITEGEPTKYFELQIATEQLTVFVPVDTMDQNIRPVISKTAAGKVLRVFKDEPQSSGKNWSRWYKVLNEKMTSGDIFQVAEVVRDLTFARETKGISPALKRMLSRARVTLESELAFAFDISTEEAAERIDRVLPIPEPVKK